MTQRVFDLAQSQRVRSAFLVQRTAVERAWGSIRAMSDQIAPGRVVVRTAAGYELLLGLNGAELWVEVLRTGL